MSQVDLHLHTNFSDGRLDPFELIEICALQGLTTISIVDHDTVDGLITAMDACSSKNIELINGIELGTIHNGEEIHLLGYYINQIDPSFLETINKFKTERLIRAKNILTKLRSNGIDISWEMIELCAGNAPIGRPHFAYVMQQYGYVETPKEAFDLYLNKGRSGYVPRQLINTVEAINLLRDNGAVPVLAHPLMSHAKSGRRGIKNLESLLTIFTSVGLQGIECYYADYNDMQINYLLKMATTYDLIPCGGSDYHAAGNINEPEPGDIGPPISSVNRLKEIHFSNLKQ
jgi:predicted metal-dependent phosphoesterase TrpH